MAKQLVGTLYPLETTSILCCGIWNKGESQLEHQCGSTSSLNKCTLVRLLAEASAWDKHNRKPAPRPSGSRRKGKGKRKGKGGRRGGNNQAQVLRRAEAGACEEEPGLEPKEAGAEDADPEAAKAATVAAAARLRLSAVECELLDAELMVARVPLAHKPNWFATQGTQSGCIVWVADPSPTVTAVTLDAPRGT